MFRASSEVGKNIGRRIAKSQEVPAGSRRGSNLFRSRKKRGGWSSQDRWARIAEEEKIC